MIKRYIPSFKIYDDIVSKYLEHIIQDNFSKIDFIGKKITHAEYVKDGIKVDLYTFGLAVSTNSPIKYIISKPSIGVAIHIHTNNSLTYLAGRSKYIYNLMQHLHNINKGMKLC